jgi:DtxR family Mn-dependent transcriptional regulator
LTDKPVTESIENYLEALWISNERSQDPAQIKWIADHLRIAPPSVVEMLQKLEKEKYVVYMPRKGVRLTGKGRRVARKIIRNHRLVEVMMKKVLHTAIDHESVCGIEHHMDKNFTDALCTLLNHPKKCPHGDPIPNGECCPELANNKNSS